MNRLNELMIERGLTQKDIAIAVGVSRPTASDWANNKKDPKGVNLQKLAAFLQVDWREILILKDRQPQPEPAPGSKEAGWNVEYPAGVSLRTVPTPPIYQQPTGLSDLDISRIAERVAQMNRDAKTSPILNSREQQLIEDYRLLSTAQKLRVQRLIDVLLDNKFNGD